MTERVDWIRLADVGAVEGHRFSTDPPRLSLPIDRRPMSRRLRALIAMTVAAVVCTAIGGSP